MRRTRIFGWRHVGLALLAASCTDFDRVDRNICGNAIVEPSRQEDCDGAPIVDGDGVSYACGAQGTIEQCRLLCSDEGRACPDGWACSLSDGICRQPRAAVFGLTEAIALPPSSRTASADLDGDGRADLVVSGDDRADGLSRLSVRFFDEEGKRAGEVLQGTAPGTLNTPLVVGPLGSVGQPGVANTSVLVAPTHTAGMMALRGRADRSLLPAVAGQFGGLGANAAILPAVHDNDSHSFGYRAIIGQASDALYHGGLIGPNVVIDTPFLKVADLQLDGVLPTNQVARGRLHSQWESERESMVLALPGEPHVRVYQRSEKVPWPYEELTMPDSVVVPNNGGSWLGDVNGDGHLDLLVAGDDGNTYLAYGLGDGSFSSSLDLEEPDWSTSSSPAIVAAHPIAVAHIDDDAYADFVFGSAHGIALSNPDAAFAHNEQLTPCPQLSAVLVPTYACGIHSLEGGTVTPASLPVWSEARIADLNLDGRLDVMAAAQDASAIDIFYTNPNSILLHHRIQTPGPVGALSKELGDFNRDGVPDLLFDVAVGDHAEILMSAGHVDGGVDAPRLLFELPVVDSLGSTKFGGALILGRDRDGEAVLATVTVDDSATPLTQSVIPCPSPDGKVQMSQQLTMGRFDDREGYDAALLYRDCYQPSGAAPVDQLVLFPAGPLGRTDPVLDTGVDYGACPWTAGIYGCKQIYDALHPTSVELVATPPWSRDALLVPIDLDPEDESQRDELVLIAPHDTVSEVAVFELDPAPPGLPRFRLRQLATIDGVFGGAYEAGWRGKAQTVDVDGDGDLDILLLSAAPEPALMVLHNDAGKLAPAATPLGLALEAQGTVRSFAVFDADYDLVADDMLLAIDERVYLVSDAFVAAASAQPIEIVAGARGVQEPIDEVIAADFNGDGLSDIAVVRASVVHMLRNLPANP